MKYSCSSVHATWSERIISHTMVFILFNLCLYHHRGLYEFHSSCSCLLFIYSMPHYSTYGCRNLSDDLNIQWQKIACYEQMSSLLFYSRFVFVFVLFLSHKTSVATFPENMTFDTKAWSKSADIQLQEFNRLELLFSIY